MEVFDTYPYVHIEKAFSDLHRISEKQFSKPGCLLKMSLASKFIVRWAFEDPYDVSVSTKYCVMYCIFKVFSHPDYYSIAKTRSGIRKDGWKFLNNIREIRQIILSQGREGLMHVNIDYILEEFQKIPNPKHFSETCLKILCINTVRKLNQLEEILCRANGDPDPNFEFDYEGPFTPKDGLFYIDSMEEEEDGATLSYNPYSSYKINHVPTDFKNFPLEFDEDSSFDKLQKSDHSKMQELIKKANYLLENHLTKFHREAYFTEKCMKHMLSSIAAYLEHFNSVVDIKKFDEERPMERQILENVDGFSFIIHSLPLIELLRPSYAKWIDSKLAALIYIINKLMAKKLQCWELCMRLMKLRRIVCQLWNLEKETKPGFNGEASKYVESKTVLQANIMTTEKSYKTWTPKFKEEETKEVLLAKCPHDECMVCYDKFDEIMEKNSKSRDLAVLPSCSHLFCSRCLESVVSASGSMSVNMYL